LLGGGGVEPALAIVDASGCGFFGSDTAGGGALVARSA
jgi:hypothetical protein